LKRLTSLFAAGCVLLVSAIIFRDFLFGNSVLVYKDAGSDSINDYYPSFVHLSDYIRTNGFPSWSFSLGMGQDLSYLAGYLVLEPVTLLRKELIAHALVYQHLAKILATGLLFFGFLQLRGLKAIASLLGSLLVSFSAYMCMGACWYPLADEVLCFSGLLLAIELTLKRGLWFIVVPAVALIGVIDAFHLYLCALFLLLYVPLRLFREYGWRPRLLLRVALQLAGAATLGACLAAVLALPNLNAMLNSPRGPGATSFLATVRSIPVLGIDSHLHYFTAALRPFANDILGTAEGFRGWQNYLEAPLTYGGLVCLLLLPQAFVGTTRRQKLIRGLFLAGICVPTLFPWFRYLFWAFQGNYYRAFSLFSILGVISLSATVFSRYHEAGRIKLWLLAATTIIVVGGLYSPIPEMQSLIDPRLKQQATLFLLGYAAVLAMGQLTRRTKLASYLIVGLVSVELTLFDYISVSAHRSTVSKEELKARVGYNDETVDAIRDIKAGDNSSFYRVTKIRPSSLGVLPSLNDAMVFGYYGTPYYSSFNNLNYIEFLIATEAITPISEVETRYSIGLLNEPMLALFAGEKYALVENPIYLQRTPQYESVRQYGKDYLFRNARFLPLGLTFDRYITEASFRALPKQAKPAVLLRALVVTKESDGEKLGLRPIELSDLEQEVRTSSLDEIVAIRRKTGLALTSFTPTRIEGDVTTAEKSVLVVQTPFDRGWQASQEGQPAATLRVDAGLLGVALEAGAHRVSLHYRTPFLALGGAFSLGSLLIFGLTAWRWPRLKLNNQS
jgi:Bacterial membrane protein YfhO